MRFWILTLWALLSCEAVQPTAVEVDTPRLVPIPQIHVESPKPIFATSASASTSTSKPEQPTAEIVDHYAGWQHWCEPLNRTTCKTRRDCKGISHPANKPMKCVRPWYAKEGSDLRVCSPGAARRPERAHKRARIRELVRIQYSNEASICEENPGWRCGQAKNRGDRLARLLNMVAHRETTMRRWTRHRLPGDIRENKTAWHLTAEDYGHGYVISGKTPAARKKRDVSFKVTGSPHFIQAWRWEYGLGLYGMNAAYFTRNWDPMAPPEVLCRDVEGTEAYLRSARSGWRKLTGGIDCDGDPGREWHGFGGSPTVYDVHHYASGGKLCPTGKSRSKFERRARGARLEPYAPIRLSELGRPIGRETQNETATLRTAQLDIFSVVWLLQRAMSG